MSAVQRPLALVYRMKPNMGCRQYPFFSIDELEKWGARHPYRDETVRLFPIVGGKFSRIGSGFIVCPATEAHKKLRDHMGDKSCAKGQP